MVDVFKRMMGSRCLTSSMESGGDQDGSLGFAELVAQQKSMDRASKKNASAQDALIVQELELEEELRKLREKRQALEKEQTERAAKQLRTEAQIEAAKPQIEQKMASVEAFRECLAKHGNVLSQELQQLMIQSLDSQVQVKKEPVSSPPSDEENNQNDDSVIDLTKGDDAQDKNPAAPSDKAKDPANAGGEDKSADQPPVSPEDGAPADDDAAAPLLSLAHAASNNEVNEEACGYTPGNVVVFCESLWMVVSCDTETRQMQAREIDTQDGGHLKSEVCSFACTGVRKAAIEDLAGIEAKYLTLTYLRNDQHKEGDVQKICSNEHVLVDQYHEGYEEYLSVMIQNREVTGVFWKPPAPPAPAPSASPASAKAPVNNSKAGESTSRADDKALAEHYAKNQIIKEKERLFVVRGHDDAGSMILASAVLQFNGEHHLDPATLHLYPCEVRSATLEDVLSDQLESFHSFRVEYQQENGELGEGKFCRKSKRDFIVLKEYIKDECLYPKVNASSITRLFWSPQAPPASAKDPIPSASTGADSSSTAARNQCTGPLRNMLNDLIKKHPNNLGPELGSRASAKNCIEKAKKLLCVDDLWVNRIEKKRKLIDLLQKCENRESERLAGQSSVVQGEDSDDDQPLKKPVRNAYKKKGQKRLRLQSDSDNDNGEEAGLSKVDQPVQNDGSSHQIPLQDSLKRSKKKRNKTKL